VKKISISHLKNNELGVEVIRDGVYGIINASRKEISYSSSS